MLKIIKRAMGQKSEDLLRAALEEGRNVQQNATMWIW